MDRQRQTDKEKNGCEIQKGGNWKRGKKVVRGLEMGEV